MSKGLDILKSCKHFIFNNTLYNSRLDADNILHYEPIHTDGDFTVKIKDANVDCFYLVIGVDTGSSNNRTERILPVHVIAPVDQLPNTTLLVKEKALDIIRMCNYYTLRYATNLNAYEITGNTIYNSTTGTTQSLNSVGIKLNRIRLGVYDMHPLKIRNMIQ